MLKTLSITTKKNLLVLQYSKVLKSRNEWKAKAIKRADENREHRKAKKHYLEIISALKAKNLLLKQSGEDKKTI